MEEGDQGQIVLVWGLWPRQPCGRVHSFAASAELPIVTEIGAMLSRNKHTNTHTTPFATAGAPVAPMETIVQVLGPRIP